MTGRAFMAGPVAMGHGSGNNGSAGARIATSPMCPAALDLQAGPTNSDDEDEGARRESSVGQEGRQDMNSWYAIERLAAAHRADLADEAARSSLAAPARRDEPTPGDRTVSRLPRIARRAVVAACAGRSVTTY